MKKSRLVALILGLVMLVSLLGGDAPEAETTKAPEESQETQTEQPSGEKVKVKLYMLPQDDDSDIVKQRFEFIKGKVEAKFPDYDIEWTRMAPGTDYRQQYDKLLMSGDGPTLWGSLPFVDIQTRMRNGTIADITDYVVNWDLRNEGKVNPSIEDALHDDEGHWFAVPYAPYIMGMLYNKTAIEAGGGSTDNVPKTWEEFGALAQSLTDKDVPRFGYTLLGSDYCAWPLTPWVWSAGGEMVIPNDDGTYSIGFNQEKGVDAIMYMHDLVFKYQCTQTDLLESYDDYMSNMTVGYACYGWGLPTSLDAEKLAAYDEKQDAEILKVLRTNNLSPDTDLADLASEAEALKATLDAHAAEVAEDEKRYKTLTDMIKKSAMSQFRDGDKKVSITGKAYTWEVSRSSTAKINKDAMKADGVLEKYTTMEDTYRITPKMIKED